MQIISGRFRGRKLRLPPDARPTQNRARIALFNILSSGLLDFTDDEFVVWDAFAGSGAFGLECLSRYPQIRVIFTDAAPSSIGTVRQNLASLGVDTRATTVQADAMTCISQYGAMADLVFLDPPYKDAASGAAFVRKLGGVIRPGALLIWEQEATNPSAFSDSQWEMLRDKQYGRARFLILRRLGE